MLVHVVHLIARLNDGGPARAIAALCASPGAARRSTVLCGACAVGERDLSAEVAASGVRVEVMPGFGRRLALGGDLRAFIAIRRRLRTLAPDVVHTHTAKAGALGRLAARSLGIPCLHTYHGHVLHGYFGPGVSQLVALGERMLAGRAYHQALTRSQYRELHLGAHIGRQARWRVLPMPIPAVARAGAPWQQALARGMPVLGFLGRLSAIKDVGLWLEMLACAQRLAAVQGLVCGDGEQRSALEQQARQLGLRVHFTGFVPADQALGAMDVLVMTSRNEGLPFAAVEAASAGVLVVAPRVGGLRDWIADGGAVGSERTASALASTSLELLADGARADAQRARARRRARALTPERMAPAYDHLYQSMRERP